MIIVVVISCLQAYRKQIGLSGNVLVKDDIDDRYSGTMLDRPALEELRHDAKADVFDAIYFPSADRLARKVAHQTIIVDELLQRPLPPLDIRDPDFWDLDGTLDVLHDHCISTARSSLQRRRRGGGRHRSKSLRAPAQAGIITIFQPQCLRKGGLQCSHQHSFS